MKRILGALKAAWVYVFGDARREMKPATDATPETPGAEPSAP